MKALRVAAVEQAPEIPPAILRIVLQLQPEVVAVRVGDLRDVRDAVALGHVINLSNWRRRVWFEALDAAELPRRRIYDMRHTYATLALAAGVPIEWIASQMGHKDTRVTLRHYARWLPATDERWLRALDVYGAEEVDQGGRTVDARADA